MLISVITPTFNRCKLLPHAVASVLQQTHAELEHIIVDDGSTDDTDRYLRSITDPRLRIVQLGHTGSLSGVRHAGVAEARGTYVAFLDSDDVWARDKLERQLAVLDNTAGARWCHGPYSMIDVRGHPIPLRAGGWECLTGDLADAMLERGMSFPLSTLLVARDAGERIGWLDKAIAYAEDLDFVLRLAESCTAAAVGEPAVAYLREHPGSASGTFRPVAHRWVARVYDRVAERSSSPRRRKLALRRGAAALSWIANNHLANGLRREGLEAMRLAGRRGMRNLAWWKAVTRLAVPKASRPPNRGPTGTGSR